MSKVLICFLLLLPYISSASELKGTYQPDPNYISYTTDNGLSNNTVTAITQNKTGFMWFGTTDGLNRFDGNNIKIYRYHPKRKNSLGGVRVTSLHVDKYNQLWVATQSGGLSLYRENTDDFLNFRYSSTDLNSLSSNSITSLESDNTELWVGTDSGLSRLNLKSFNIQRVPFINNHGTGTNHSKISSLKRDGSDLWIGTSGGGLNRYNSKTKYYSYFRHNFKSNKSLNSDDVSSIFIDNFNEVWIGTERDGLNRYEKDCQCFRSYKSDVNNPTTLPDNRILTFTENQNNELWIGTNRGVVVYDRTADNFKRYRLIKPSDMGKAIRNIHASYTSSDGTVWLGSLQMGVISIPHDGFRFQTYRYGKGNSNLKYDDINSIHIENNEMWTGSTHGLLRYQIGDNNQLSFLNEIYHSFALKILKSSDSSYWLATNVGLMHFDENLKKLSHFDQKDFSKYKIREDAVLDVIETKNGNIFIASWEGGLSQLINEQKAEFDIIGLEKDPRGALQSLSIYALHEDQQDNIWIGSLKGIDRYNQLYRKIKNYSLLDDEHIKATVYYVFEGKSGLWLGTNFGLYRYISTDDKFVHFPIALDNQYIQAIAEESDNILWLTTFNGMYRVNLTNSEATKFTKADGIQGNEFNTKGVFKTADGRLYFSGTEGVTKIDTKKFTSNSFKSTVKFSTLHYLESGTKKRINELSQIDLKANENNFSISFFVDDYRSPTKLKYRYKLNNGKWNELVNTREIQFLNQEYGLLKLEVQTTNHLGIWQLNTQSLIIRIHPPFGQTNIAYILYFLVVISFIIIAYKIRLKRIKQYQKRLQDKVSERTSEVNNLLIQKQNLFTNISHELRTPLTLISAPLKQLVDDKTFTPKQNKLLELANNNSKRLFHLVEKILNLTSIEQKNKNRQNVVMDDQLIKYIIAFEPLLQAKNIQLSNYLDSDAVVYADNDELTSVIENLFSNTLKYTLEHGWVKLNSSITDNQYQLIIENSHQGLDVTETEKVFERFERLGQSDSVQGFGLGLAFVKEICQQNDWQIDCISAKGKSVSFILTISDYSISQQQTGTPAQRQINQLGINKKSKIVNAKQSVLIVEDNSELRDFLAEIFSTDYRVTTAKNGLLGVNSAVDEIPDIIISDIMMPELDGYQLVQQLAQHDNTCHVPVILLTAKADKESELKGLELGSVDYIAKPFDAKELLLKVKNILVRRKSFFNLTNNSREINDTQYISERDKRFNEKLNKIVEKNYNDSDFNVEQLVDQIAMSERQLQRKLKAVFNQTPAEFIRYYRLQKSKELLLAGKSISNVADLVGFNSSSYFSRSFRSTFNQSPSEFIQQKVVY